MEAYFYLGIFAIILIAVGISSAIFSKKVFREELMNSHKLDISIDQMITSEKNIEKFYKKNNLDYTSSIKRIAELLKIKEAIGDPGDANQAYLSEPDDKGNMTLIIRENVSDEDRRFILAHECAHLINDDPLPNARSGGKNKSQIEQLADYTAAAILMPINEIRDHLEKSDYKNLTARKRASIIKKMCVKYEVSRIIALRRVSEVSRLIEN